MRRNRLKLAYWYAVTVLLAAIPVWGLVSGEKPFWRPASTPADAVDPLTAEQWGFLKQARHAILPGSTYTVRAADREVERKLFELSLGLCLERVAVPTTYDRRTGKANPNDARFVVGWNEFKGAEQLQFVVRFPGGAIYERTTAKAASP